MPNNNSSKESNKRFYTSGNEIPAAAAEKAFSCDLVRFHTAQRSSWSSALSEIKSGRKQSHWMWFIFPQIEGLGYSDTARYYAIRNLEEARAYLKDPVLGGRLREISEALLQLDTDDPTQVVGYPDDLKLKSSMTLFEKAGEGTSDAELFGKVLEKYFRGQRDHHTLERI